MMEKMELGDDNSKIHHVEITFAKIGNMTLNQGKLSLDEEQDQAVLAFAFDYLKGETLVIKIKNSEIKQIRQVLVAVGSYMRFILSPAKIQQINEQIHDFGFCFQIGKDPSMKEFIVKFKALSENDVEFIKHFYRKTNVVNEIEEEDFEDVIILSDEIDKPIPELRKKKHQNVIDEEEDHPKEKRARRKQKEIKIDLVEDDERPKRNLRSKTRTNYADENDYVLQDVSEEAQLEEALKRSMKCTKNDKIANKKESSKLVKTLSETFPDIDKTIVLFTYENIIVRMEDYLCLSRNEYLSNVNLDFYLQYIYQTKMSAEQRKKTFIFPSHFYSLYSISPEFSGWNNEENAGLSAAQKRYKRVDGILGDVNIFEKEFLVIPLMSSNHWFLAIVCYPTLNGSYTFDGVKVEGDDAKRNMKKEDLTAPPLKTSCILIFDSISGNGGRRTTAMTHIKNFFYSEWEEKYTNVFQLEKKGITGSNPRVPLQSNNFDCGCYLLEFVERFFVSSPIVNFRLPMDLSNWFDSEKVRLEKRREIASVFENFMTDSQIDLPKLDFCGDSQVILVDSEANEEDADDKSNNSEYNNNNINCLDSNTNEQFQVKSEKRITMERSKSGEDLNETSNAIETEDSDMEVKNCIGEKEGEEDEKIDEKSTEDDSHKTIDEKTETVEEDFIPSYNNPISLSDDEIKNKIIAEKMTTVEDEKLSDEDIFSMAASEADDEDMPLDGNEKTVELENMDTQEINKETTDETSDCNNFTTLLFASTDVMLNENDSIVLSD